MRRGAAGDITGLWEAWIDLESGNNTLYVVGDICVGRSRTAPVLLKKSVQGVAASHLMLEVMPLFDPNSTRMAEVGYAEPIADITKYQQISICAGEDVIARISTIELLY